MSAQFRRRGSSEPERAEADITELGHLLHSPLDVRSPALTGILILAVFYTLYFARPFLLPIVLALLLNFLLGPIVRALEKLRVPTALGAGIVLVILLGAAGYASYRLAEPAAAWMATVPESIRRIEDKVGVLRKPVQEISEAAEQVQDLATVDNTKVTQAVQIKGPSLADSLLTLTGGFVGSALVMFILLYFLLASGDLFLRKLVRVLPRLEDEKVAVQIARQIETQISNYLLTVTLINAGLGLAVGLAMFLIGLPNPVLWGVMVGLFNFVPYLGPIVSLTVLTLVAVITFDDLGKALVAPGVYFIFHTFEGYLITPLLLGRRLTLNPLVIFVAVIFWGWLWGIGGALLAVPMLATFKIFCDQVKPLASIGEFLGR